MPWYSSIWETLNQPFVLFVLGSVVLTIITRYLNARMSSRETNREIIRYVLESISRLNYVVANLPIQEKITMSDWWSVSNALEGSEAHTIYSSIFKEFAGQRTIELLTYLALRLKNYRERIESVISTINDFHDILGPSGSTRLHPDVHIEELEELKEELEEVKEDEDEVLPAQIYTAFVLPPARLEKLMELMTDIKHHIHVLERLRERLEKRL